VMFTLDSRVSRPFVLACDEGYAMPLATTLRSLVEANRSGWPLEVHILSVGFSENVKRKVVNSLPEGSASIRWLPVDLARFAGWSTIEHISKATYARLLISSIFPDGVHRALYLDADTLVLDDLSPLWEMDLEGAVLGAVPDEGLGTEVRLGNENLAAVPGVRDYFNAGVLLIDLARWREEGIPEKALEYLKRYPHSPFSDQDALNVACDGLWKRLDPRWNYQAHCKRRISDLRAPQRPGIVHFVTWVKPWDARCPRLNAEFYDDFRTRTSFARTPADKLVDALKVIWSRLKSVLKRSVVVRQIWYQVRLPQSHRGRNSAPRVSAE